MQRRYAWIALIVVAVVIGYFAGRVDTPATAMPSQAARLGGDDATLTKQTSATEKKLTAARSTASSTACARTSAQPLPPPGTPLKQIRDELQARADTGDAEAASRLYRDTGRCAEVRRINSWAPRYARTMLNDANAPKTLEELKIRDQQLGNIQEKLDFAKNNATLCAGLSDDEIDQLVPIALQAAQAGDFRAADCYVGGVGLPGGLPAGLVDHPEWLSEYRNNALSIADAAVARGDWTMVQQLAQAYEGGPFNTLLSQVTGENRALAYRYSRLVRLGAATDNKNSLAYLDHRLTDLANDITPEAKAAADAWAQDAYRNLFAGRPANTNYNGYHICNMDDAER